MENNVLSVSIVLYNTVDLMLERVINSFGNENVQIYLIDNSPEGRVNSFINNAKIKYIHNNKNIGFGSAHNIAIKMSIAENTRYHLVLNPDIYFTPDIIQKIIKFMDDDSDIGLLMPEILYPNNQIQYLPKLLPSLFSLIKRKLLNYSKSNNLYELRNLPQQMIYEAPIISGCFSFFRIAALKEVGLYDERFFMYFEDFDISRRVHKKFKTVYYPQVSVYHEYGRGAQKNFILFKIFVKSAIKYFNKWGWIFDSERRRVNRLVLEKIRSDSF
jgi:GT2 family glycosyltransferase